MHREYCIVKDGNGFQLCFVLQADVEVCERCCVGKETRPWGGLNGSSSAQGVGNNTSSEYTSDAGIVMYFGLCHALQLFLYHLRG
jgi:hypothetical protein